jgi:hypothetical protein
MVPIPSQEDTLELWWNSTLVHTPREYKRCLAAILIYTCWNLWKERNRGIFENASLPPTCILSLVKQEVRLKSFACGEGALPH